MTILIALAAGLAGLAAGALFSQRIKDWFAGVESDLRAKATDAGKAVLAAAAAEESRIKEASRAAADRAVAGAKDAVAGASAKVFQPAPPVVEPAAPPAA